MIVVDAGWVIALRDPDDAHHRDARDANAEVGADERVLIHPLTLAECLVAPALLGQADEAAEVLRAAFEVVTVGADDAVRWARLRAETGLKLPDAIVLDTAIVHQARVFTFDRHLREHASDRR